MTKVIWLLLAASISSIGIGIILVLVFINDLVIPSVNQYRYVSDLCLVLNITKKPLGEFGPKDKAPSTKNGHLTSKGPSPEDNTDRVTDGQSLSAKTNVTNSCYVVYILYGVGATDIVIPRIVPDTKRGVLLQHRHRDENENTKLCFCFRCHIEASKANESFSLAYGNKLIKVGDTIKCTQRRQSDMTIWTDGGGNVTIKGQRKWPLFSAMLWPSTMFVFGFVGLFIVPIYLAKHDWKWT